MCDDTPDFQALRECMTRAKTVPPSSDFDLNLDTPPGKPLRLAAVLLPLVQRQGEIRLILTKRAAALKHHPGQISFPGGKIETSDASPVQAALREAQEEIGLHPDLAMPLGELPAHQTISDFRVQPFVAQVDPAFLPQPDHNEVAEVFEVPLAHVLNPANFRVEGRLWRNKMRYYYVVPYGPYYIWGATARMLRLFAAMMEDAREN